MASPTDTKKLKPRFKSVGHKDGLVDRVVRAIEDQILRGKLQVGSRLPAEREFSEQLGVSRPVVREAVRILTAKGMLETRHGVGTTVRALSCAEVVKPLKLFLRIRNEDVSVEHLHQVRSILEVESAGMAAENATPEDIEDLAQICREMDEAAHDSERFAQKDSEFHRRLGQTSYNPLLTLLLDSVHDLMTEVRSIIAAESGVYERVMPTHARILTAVMASDRAAAREAMRLHLEIALSVQIQAIKNSTGAG